MQVIAGIEIGAEPFRIVWIASSGLEIDYTIEGASGTNPGVYRLADRFALMSRVVRAFIRRQSAADHFNAVRVCSFDDLLVRANQIFGGDGFDIAATDVIDAFEHHHPLHTRLAQHVAIEPCERA